MNQKLRKTVCILIFYLAVLVSIPAGAQQFQALTGVPGTTFISPKGETKLGSTTIWTESGLASSVVLHEKNPNNIRLGVVQIELKQGATIKGKSLESVLSRNFISIITEKDQKILWIPFDAIDSLNVKCQDIGYPSLMVKNVTTSVTRRGSRRAPYGALSDGKRYLKVSTFSLPRYTCRA